MTPTIWNRKGLQLGFLRTDAGVHPWRLGQRAKYLEGSVERAFPNHL
jgi:hypothetical protein